MNAFQAQNKDYFLRFLLNFPLFSLINSFHFFLLLLFFTITIISNLLFFSFVAGHVALAEEWAKRGNVEEGLFVLSLVLRVSPQPPSEFFTTLDELCDGKILLLVLVLVMKKCPFLSF